MYVQVRTIDGKRNVTVTISKVTTVKDFKAIIKNELDIEVEKQRLFFRGKQLEDNYKLFDYNINVNDVVQLMIRNELPPVDSKPVVENKHESEVPENPPSETSVSNKIEAESLYYKVGDVVDAKDTCYGGWFEGKILAILKEATKNNDDSENELEDGLLYKVAFNSYPDDDPLLLHLKDIRPRAREVISLSSINIGDTVLVNYNIEEPTERGYWYDLKVTSIKQRRKKTELEGTLYVGTERTPLLDTVIHFTDDIMRIELPKLISQRSEEELKLMQTETKNKRINAPYCSNCSDNARRKCRECGCNRCGGKNEPDKQIMCDECNMAFHIWCLTPPLSEIPDADEWYCVDCKNDENEIVKAGDKLKESKKKAKMASSNSNSSRDWGKGMACVGRTKECTLVRPNHFGPIPGIEVGTLWKFRVQVSEAGVHRPHVAGIHGRESEGAYSIVLSGGYEDDIDNGDEFMYTGSGGRDLSGNKRTAEQSSDQTLTRMNKALAMNCNVPLDSKKGAEATDWRGGKPVRVVRNFKLAKHSKYAPKDGNRYDGIYKVVKYYPQKGKSGFIVWRYVLRRDDPSPSPWTKEGKKHIEALGLEMLYPEGYLAAMEKKENDGTIGSYFGKRILEEAQQNSPSKRTKLLAFEIDDETKKHIENDNQNSKLWDTAKESLSLGKQKFLNKVEEIFMCICCQELVFNPVTTKCLHNICLVCLERSFAAEVYTCPYCRTELGKKSSMSVNKSLQEALLNLFPGYGTGR